MKFKIDENLPAELAGDIRRAGDEAETVGDEGLAGADDRTILEKARNERRIVLTLDKGMADLRVHTQAGHKGIVLFRPGASGRGAVAAFVRRSLPALFEVDLSGRLVIITPRGVRIR